MCLYYVYMGGAINSGPPPAGVTNCAISICTVEMVLCVHVIWSEFAQVLRIPCAFRRAWVRTGKFVTTGSGHKKRCFVWPLSQYLQFFRRPEAAYQILDFAPMAKTEWKKSFALGPIRLSTFLSERPNATAQMRSKEFVTTSPQIFYCVSLYGINDPPHVYTYL